MLAALVAVPTVLLGPALQRGSALLPADLLVQFEPWRSLVEEVPSAHWDPLIWDGMSQYYPWRLFAAESLRAGVIPLWNPYQFCGTPFLANGQSAVLYPLNLLFWVLPTARAFGWSAWLHLALTGWFMYLLLRRIGSGRLGSLTGALVWQANGFFAAWIHLPTVLCTASWIPLVLLLCERALTGGRARRAVSAGAALGTAYLGGHPQIFLLAALLSAAYLVARGLRRGLGRPLLLRVSRLVRAGTVAGAVAAGLAACQLLPTLSLLRMAHRTFMPGPESYRAFLSHSLPPLQLAGLVIPHAFGHPGLGTYAGRDNYAEYALYVGVLALAVAAYAVFSSRTWHARFFAGALLAALLVALGTQVNAPLYRWVPGFARAGGPGRTLLIAVFSLCVLAGLGTERIIRRSAEGGLRSRAWLLALLGLFAAAAAAWGWIGAPAVAQVKPGAAPLADREVVRAVLIVVAGIAVIALTGGRSLHATAHVAWLVLLAADPVLAARGHIHITPAEWAYADVGLAEPGQGRIVGNARDWPIDRFPRAVLPPNSAMVYHLRDVFGYDSLYLARYRDFAAAVQHGDPSPALNGNMLLARLGKVYGLDMMSLAAAEKVYSPAPVNGLRMQREGAFYTYHNPYVRPRVWVAQSAVFQPTHADAVVALVQLGPLQDTLLITGGDEPVEPVPPGAAHTAVVEDLSPNGVEVHLPQGGGGYLFLADSFAPGWRAFAGNRELTVRAAYVTFRAVAVPQEADAVVFRYEPDGFRVGLFITLLALACLGTAGGWACTSRQG